MFLQRSTNHGILSAEHWRCSLTEEPNWFARSFDDSEWSNAVKSQHHNTYHTNNFLRNFQGGRMIWHYNFTYDGPVYCRVHFDYGKLFFIFFVEKLSFLLENMRMWLYIKVAPDWSAFVGASVAFYEGCAAIVTLDGLTEGACITECQVCKTKGTSFLWHIINVMLEAQVCTKFTHHFLRYMLNW